MEIPERLRELVDQLGQSLVQALANDPASRAFAQQIQEEGYDIALMLEATVALHRRESEPGEAETGESLEALDEETSIRSILPPPQLAPEPKPDATWSEEDKAFLRTFKIKLD